MRPRGRAPALTKLDPESELTAPILPSQDAACVRELLDCRSLLAVNPAGDDSEQQSEGLETQHDAEIVPVGRNVAGC